MYKIVALKKVFVIGVELKTSKKTNKDYVVLTVCDEDSNVHKVIARNDLEKIITLKQSDVVTVKLEVHYNDNRVNLLQLL